MSFEGVKENGQNRQPGGEEPKQGSKLDALDPNASKEAKLKPPSKQVILEPEIKEREAVGSYFWVNEMHKHEESERFSEIEIIARELCGLLSIPTGAFCGMATAFYYDDEGEKREEIILLELDKLMAKIFTNQRYIVKKINEIGPISTKDPREKYEGKIDAVIEQLKKDFEEYKTKVEKIKSELESKEMNPEIKERTFKLLDDALQVYTILEGELELKRRGFENDEKGLCNADDSRKFLPNTTLEIKYLPGGNIVILRGYQHIQEWQKRFGEGAKPNLASIYKNVEYVAIEGAADMHYGNSLKVFWSKESIGSFDRLMKALVKNGFAGQFIELDPRYNGALVQLSFGSGATEIQSPLSFEDDELPHYYAQDLFNFVRKINPQLAGPDGRIKTIDEFIKYFHAQRTFLGGDKSDLVERATKEGLEFTQNGTIYHNNASIDSRGKTTSYPTGFELGELAFSDALSVIKILILGEAMHKGDINPGILVDFQGTAHTSYKSYFFDNPQYAMKVVLTNLWEVLASYPDIHFKEVILKKLNNLDKDTWKWALDFITKIPFTTVAPPGIWKRSVNPSPRLKRQRPMSDPKWYSPLKNLTAEQQAKLDSIIDRLTELTANKAGGKEY